MKVIQFGKYYPPHRGGMESFLAALCQGLCQKGVQCQVLAATESGATSVQQEGGVEVHRLRSFGTFQSLPLCPAAIGALHGSVADIIHLHHPNPLGDWAYLLSRPRGRLVVTYHSDIIGKEWLSRLHAPLPHRVLDRADAIVASSPQYVASSSVLKKYEHKVSIIPLGVAAQDYDALNRNVPKQRDRNGAAPQYLFIGRLVPYKGVPVLLDALRNVPGNLWIAGAGPLEGQLKRQVRQNNLQDRVEFLGDIGEPEKYSLLAACDALILPSLTRAEAFGMVLLEAMAMGKPVVVSDLPTGVRLLVRHGHNGLKFQPGSASALAAALRYFIEDPAKAREMGEAGRKLVLEHYTVEKMVDKYLELYRRLQNHNG
jgi:glycosyltransferase involved in cell wall biosynthesis